MPGLLDRRCLVRSPTQDAVQTPPTPLHLPTPLESSVSFGIPDDFKELVRERTNLVELVSATVELQALRGGLDYVGLCPFHQDNNPSFHVYPDRNTYRCWVCDAGGDCFSWAMEIERLSFPEAIEFLADRLGMEVPRQNGGRPQQNKQQRQSLFDVLAWAETEMHNFLRGSAEAAKVRDYLGGRGYNDDVIQQFKLGYHPEDQNWFINQCRGKFTEEQLFRVGLRLEGNYGFYDHFLFKDRLVFPVRDDRGRPVAFGGRVLPGGDDSRGKYQNSSENDFFKKSNVLYAFDVANQTIRKTGTTYVVEGYTDCISCHQHGVTNVVATLGTALTEQHVAKIKRFGKRVVLVYDGDTAGQNAAERAISRLLAQEIDLRVMTLPDGEDPADFVSRAGSSAFNELANEAPEAIDYKFDRCVARHGTDSINAREQVRDETLDLLVQCQHLDGTDRMDMILGKLARKLVTEEWRIRNRLEELRQQVARRQRFQPEELPQPAPISTASKVENEVLEILFTQPDLFNAIRSEIGSEDFNNIRLRTLFERILDLSEEGTFNGSESVLNSLDADLELKKLTVALADSARDKNIESLLNADVAEGQLSYLTSVLNAITLRRTERQTELSKHTLSSATGEPTDDTLDALRRLQQAKLDRMRHPKSLK